MKKLLLLFILFYSGAKAQVFTVDTIIKTGPLNKRINFVYLADGYTAAEQAKFITDVININNKLFNTIPFTEYKDYFNVFAIKVISNESGIKHASTAPDCPGVGTHPVSNPKNYFGTKFDVANIHRLVVPDSFAKVNAVLAANFPEYDQVMVVGNTSFYGGSGGALATSTTHTSAAEIMIHEIGHSFASLADEYWAGIQYATEKPNMTAQSDPLLVKWKNWIGSPGIGVFAHSGSPLWFKPTTGGTCKMEVLNPAFCRVCKETFVERIHTLVSPIDSYIPSNAATLNISNTIGFKTNLLKPIPNTLNQTWFLDNVQQAATIDTFTILSGSIANGNHTLRTTVVDNTSLSRADNHLSLHTYNVLWNMSIATGVTEVQVFNAGLKLFPNPFAENLVIQYKLSKPSSVAINLVTANGKNIPLVQEKKQMQGSYSSTFSLNRYGLSAGVYTIVFIVNGQTIAREIIKLK
ncbi:MAG: T9SS type A sorting domain-containing protein [Chitinophagaceae bacterium]|nr:T9SS type A sorting domain-containing protein [Chitinophagaceae bacterium]